MTYEEMKTRIGEAIETHLAELICQNDDIARHPELSGKEYRSAQKHVALLQKHGYRTEFPFAGLETAFRAVYGPDDHKHKIAVLAEYDALPEIGHACGHCLSGCISLLAGLALRDLQDELDADIHVIGTPNEEQDGAKCAMARDGIFEAYDLAIMVHLYNQNIAAPAFQALASCLYEFHGKGLPCRGGAVGGDQCAQRLPVDAARRGYAASAHPIGCAVPRSDPQWRGRAEYRSGKGLAGDLCARR